MSTTTRPATRTCWCSDWPWASMVTMAMKSSTHKCQIASGDPRISDALLLFMFASVAIGGTSLFGGQGGVVGTLIGRDALGIHAPAIGAPLASSATVLNFVRPCASMTSCLRRSSAMSADSASRSICPTGASTSRRDTSAATRVRAGAGSSHAYARSMLRISPAVTVAPGAPPVAWAERLHRDAFSDRSAALYFK